MSTRLKIRIGYISVILLLIIFGRGNPNARMMIGIVRILFYVGLLGFFIYGYIARRRKTDKEDAVAEDIVPLVAEPIKPGPDDSLAPKR